MSALFCKAKVIIGPSGFVQGEIRCENAVIEGKFDGHLYVSGLLNIREKANIKGDVQTDKLIVQSGAIFNVSCCNLQHQKLLSNASNRLQIIKHRNYIDSV